MHNEHTSVDEKEVTQITIETVLKLAHSGSSPEAISSFLGLNPQQVQEIIANDPMYNARLVQSIKEKSAEYRCSLSSRLMISPVMDRNENFYEQSIIEADSSLSIDQFTQSKKLKAKIGEFSKESLKVLERCLQQKLANEDILDLTAECLSVLCPDAGVEAALRVLGAVEGKAVRMLFGKLKGLVPEEMVLSLMNQTARELPSHALCLAALIIMEPRSERALEEAFRCFAELLSQVSLDAGAISLAEEVSEKLSSSQLRQMNAALGACPKEEEHRLDELRLREAYALLREGEVKEAICLVKSLRINPRTEKEVLKLYDEAGESSGKAYILEQKLSARLEEISRDSPFLAESLNILHHLFKEELQSLKPAYQSLISMKAENESLAKLCQQTSHALIAQDARIQKLEELIQRREAESQETLAKIEGLTVELQKTVEESSQAKRAQDAQIQRAEAASEEVLISVRAELQTFLHEQAAKSGEEAKRVQSFIEQSEKATDEVLSKLRGEVAELSKDLAQVMNECTRRAQLAQEETLQMIEGNYQRVNAALDRLRGKVEALNKEHLKAGEETKLDKKAQDARIQQLDKKCNETEAAIRQSLNILEAWIAPVQEGSVRSSDTFSRKPKGLFEFISSSGIDYQPVRTASIADLL